MINFDALKNANEWRNAKPFPHFYVDNFLTNIANQLEADARL